MPLKYSYVEELSDKSLAPSDQVGRLEVNLSTFTTFTIYLCRYLEIMSDATDVKQKYAYKRTHLLAFFQMFIQCL